MPVSGVPVVHTIGLIYLKLEIIFQGGYTGRLILPDKIIHRFQLNLIYVTVFMLTIPVPGMIGFYRMCSARNNPKKVYAKGNLCELYKCR